MKRSRRACPLLLALFLGLLPPLPAAQRSGSGEAAPAARPVAAPVPALPQTTVAGPPIPSASVVTGLPADARVQAPVLDLAAPATTPAAHGAQPDVPAAGTLGIEPRSGFVPAESLGRAFARPAPGHRPGAGNAPASSRENGSLDAAPSLPAAPASLPTQAGLGARVSDVVRIQGLDDEKRDGVVLPEASAAGTALAPALAAAEAGERRGGSEPPAPPDLDEPSRAPARAFLTSILITQMGGEIIYLAVVQIAHKLSGSFSTDSLLGAVSFAALTLGSLVAGPAIDRFGIRKTYLAILGMELAAGAALAGLYAVGVIGFAPLLALFALDYLALGGRRVSESVMPTVLFSSSKSRVNSFSNLQEMAVEAMGLLGLTAVGLLLPLLGSGGTLALYPLLMLAATAVTLAFLRLPAGTAGRGSGESLKQRITGVWRALKANPLLRRAVAGYAMSQIIYAFAYFAIIPNFGLFAARPGLTSSSAMFWASIVFASGGLSGTLLMAWLNARAERRIAALPESERKASDHRSLLGTAARWALAASAVLLGAWSLLLPATPLGAVPAFAFLAPLSLALAGVYVNLESVIKTEAPVEIRGSVMGVIRAGALLAASLSFPLLGLMFDAFSTVTDGSRVPTPGAFAILALLLSGASGVYFFLSRSLRPKAAPR